MASSEIPADPTLVSILYIAISIEKVVLFCYAPEPSNRARPDSFSRPATTAGGDILRGFQVQVGVCEVSSIIRIVRTNYQARC